MEYRNQIEQKYDNVRGSSPSLLRRCIYTYLSLKYVFCCKLLFSDYNCAQEDDFRKKEIYECPKIVNDRYSSHSFSFQI